MAKLEVQVARQKETVLYGLWGKTSDRTAASDIPALSARYHQAVGRAEGSVLPFFVLGKDYDENTGASDLFIAGLAKHPQCDEWVLPEGSYASVMVRPKLGCLWGPAVGEAKRWFYTRWLPQSPYRALNLEYEYHTEETVGRHPALELRFAICEKSV